MTHKVLVNQPLGKEEEGNFVMCSCLLMSVVELPHGGQL